MHGHGSPRKLTLIASLAVEMNTACIELAMDWSECQRAIRWHDFRIDAARCSSPIELAALAMVLLPDRDNADSLEVVCVGVWTFLVALCGDAPRGPRDADAPMLIESAAKKGLKEADFNEMFGRWWT